MWYDVAAGCNDVADRCAEAMFVVRTQILLEETQYQYLKNRSRETGESLSALIRGSIDRLRKAETPLSQRAVTLLGSFEADRTDVSIHHDEYFAGLEPETE